MTREPHPFEPTSGEDLKHLAEAQPLGWIVSGYGDAFRATLMPFRPWQMQGGEVVQFASHLPRANDQVGFLREMPDAHLLFLGPNAYISPNMVGDRTWAPTWNFASASVRVTIEFRDNPDDLRVILEDLVGAMESGRDEPWSVSELGERYAALSQRIVGFIAHVVESEERYKLGQDESDAVFDRITRGLEAEGRRDLQAWMERFAKDRGD